MLSSTLMKKLSGPNVGSNAMTICIMETYIKIVISSKNSTM